MTGATKSIPFVKNDTIAHDITTVTWKSGLPSCLNYSASAALSPSCWQALCVFVDLGHKIIIQNTVFKIYDGAAGDAANYRQCPDPATVYYVSSLRGQFRQIPKNKVMRISAWVAVGLTLAITGLLLAKWAVAYSKASFP